MKTTRHLIFLLIPVILASCARSKYPATCSEKALQLYKNGEEYRRQLHYRDALNNYLKAFKTDSAFALAAVKSGQMYFSFGENDSGRYYLEKARQLVSSIPQLDRMVVNYYWSSFQRDEKRMSALADSLMLLYPENFDARVINAFDKWRNLQFAEARKLFQDLLRDYPNYIIAYNNIGYLYAREGLFKEAVTYLEKYKRYATNQLNPYDSLAEIYIAVGRYYEAIHMLESLMKNHTDELMHNEYLGATVFIRLSIAYRKLGQYSKALEILNQAEQKFASNYALRIIYLNRFAIYRELCQTNQMDEILEKIKTLIPNGEYRYQSAILAIEKGKYSQVIDILNSFKTDKQQTHISDHNFLITYAAIEGELNLKTGMYAEASEKFKRAADTYNDILNSTDLRIKEYYSEGNAGNYDAALKGFRKIIEVNPNHPHALVYAAEFFLKTGRKSEALSYINYFFKTWKNADPNTPLLRQAESIADALNQ